MDGYRAAFGADPEVGKTGRQIALNQLVTAAQAVTLFEIEQLQDTHPALFSKLYVVLKAAEQL